MPFAILIFSIIISLDLYLWWVVRQIHLKKSTKRYLGTAVVWGSTLLFILLYFIYKNDQSTPTSIGKSFYFVYALMLFFGKAIAALFFLLDDIRRIFQWLILFFVKSTKPKNKSNDHLRVSRSGFLSWLGVGFSSLFSGTILYGMNNRYRYQVKTVSITSPKIPASFKGLKIVQISDIHSGSFTSLEGPAKGIEIIQNLQPDLILFTGDLVNNSSEEMNPYINIFKQLSAPFGVYSVLGNHDYAQYKNASIENKKEDFEYMLKVHDLLNWKLLRNEHVVLEKNGEKIALIGVENWSKDNRFPTHGDLKKAIDGLDTSLFQILMSHDPTHWEAEVLNSYPTIDLTLSGHTHGMQFGFEIPGYKWSPVSLFYKHWMGLYKKGNQQLYVNTGYGFIGYSGRVGILPEITVFELN